MGVFVRSAAEELMKPTMCVRKVPSDDYKQCKGPERPSMIIRTNHGRENETCNGRKLPTNYVLRCEGVKLIFIMAFQP